MKFDTVFLDMDGVLADFVSMTLPLFGTTLEDFLPKWPAGDWHYDKIIAGSSDEFWRKIDSMGQNFWPGLNPYPWLKELVAVAASLSGSVKILSSPSRSPHCYSGKRQWAQRHLPEDMEMILCASKHLIAAPGRLLIDDSDKNVDAWRKAGGTAILFPQHWNSGHDKAPFGPLFYLGQEIERLRVEQERDSEIPEGFTATRGELRKSTAKAFVDAVERASIAKQPPSLDMGGSLVPTADRTDDLMTGMHDAGREMARKMDAAVDAAMDRAAKKPVATLMGAPVYESSDPVLNDTGEIALAPLTKEHAARVVNAEPEPDFRNRVAVCSRNRVGYITGCKRVTYPDKTQSVAWIGVGLDDGSPWSSRHPVLLTDEEIERRSRESEDFAKRLFEAKNPGLSSARGA